MRRIIGREVFEGKPLDGEFAMTVHELGNGHREVSIRQRIGWTCVHELSADIHEWMVDKYGPDSNTTEAEKRRANAERAARRAKARVRRLVKSMGCDSMLTLTYRENMVDRDRLVADLKEFVRRIRRLIPGFGYVAAFEQQERGAWHIHMAIHRLPQKLSAANGVKVKSWQVVRACWRAVVGQDNGNVDERRRKASSGRSAAKLAGYLSKYMMKAFSEGDAWSNRFSASRHSIPAPVRQEFHGAALRELISLAWAFGADGDCEVCTSWLSPFGDTYFLATEGPPPR